MSFVYTNPPFDLSTDRIPWCHYRTNGGTNIGQNAWTSVSFVKGEGNVSLHGEKDLTAGVQWLQFPTGLQGIWMVTWAAHWTTSAGTQGYRYGSAEVRDSTSTTIKQDVFFYYNKLVSSGQTLPMGSGGMVQVEAGQTISLMFYSSSTLTQVVNAGDSTTYPGYGLYLARISPGQNLVARYSAAGGTIL